MTDPKPESPPQIDYAPSARRRGWSKKYLIAGLMFLAAVAFVYEWPQVQRFHAITQAYMWQRRAMSFMLPKGTIVYSDDPSEIARRVSDPDYFRLTKSGPIGRGVPVLRQLELWLRHDPAKSYPLNPIPDAAVLLHSRSAGTYKTLLAISVVPFVFPDGSRLITFYQTDIRPGTLLRFPSSDGRFGLENFPLDPDDRFTVFAGQVDPSDPSHFTIKYLLNGESGSIDGRLSATGMIEWNPDDTMVALELAPGQSQAGSRFLPTSLPAH